MNNTVITRDGLQNMIGHAISEEIISPVDLLRALGNVCAHGKPFQDSGYELDDDDEYLKKFHKGLDMAKEALSKMGYA